MEGRSEGQGQLIVYTGAGKGKTTAALGLACRAVGHGKRAVFIHFTGPEHPRLGDVAGTAGIGAELKMIGIECQASDTSYLCDFDESVATVEAALARARELVAAEECDVLVLDDINPLLDRGIVDTASVTGLISDKPPTMTVVSTGRSVPEAIVEMADVVTDFAEVRHPAQAGVEPRKGIDF